MDQKVKSRIKKLLTAREKNTNEMSSVANNKNKNSHFEIKRWKIRCEAYRDGDD